MLYDILEQKTAVLGSKNKKSKHQKNKIFSKGLTHGFNPQMPFFPSIVLEKIDQENVFSDNLRKKKTFLGCKNKTFKKSKKWHFSRG